VIVNFKAEIFPFRWIVSATTLAEVKVARAAKAKKKTTDQEF
jgi:hypothetical protein